MFVLGPDFQFFVWGTVTIVLFVWAFSSNYDVCLLLLLVDSVQIRFLLV